nr:hypothetical protein [Parachlamydiaceae bacterium]
MKNENQKPDLEYKLLRVATTKFNFEAPQVKNEFEVTYNIAPTLTLRVDLSTIFIKISISGELADTRQQVVNIETVSAFQVTNLE